MNWNANLTGEMRVRNWHCRTISHWLLTVLISHTHTHTHSIIMTVNCMTGTSDIQRIVSWYKMPSGSFWLPAAVNSIIIYIPQSLYKGVCVFRHWERTTLTVSSQTYNRHQQQHGLYLERQWSVHGLVEPLSRRFIFLKGAGGRKALVVVNSMNF